MKIKTIPEYICDILPDSVIYRAVIKAWAYSTTGEYANTNATDLTAIEMIKRWDTKEPK